MSTVSTAISTVLLDFGGTLDGPGLHWSTQFARAFASGGVAVERARLDQAFLASERALERATGIASLGLEAYVARQTELIFEALGLPPDGCGRVVRPFVEQSRRHLEATRLLLAAHRRIFRFGIVSNFCANLPVIVRDAGLEPLVDAVVVSELTGLRKPDAAIFALALAQLGSSAAETAMIGDSLRSDVMGARSAGMIAVWLRGEETFGGGDPAAATFVARNLEESLALLGAAPLETSDRLHRKVVDARGHHRSR